MDIANVMDAVAIQLGSISDLNVYPYPPGSVEPPAAIVSYPEDITYDGTYRRGMDSLTLPVILVAGRVDDQSTRDAIAAYCNGTGARSVKAVVEAATYAAFDTVAVTEATLDVVTIGGVDYMAVTFKLSITGSGS